MAAKRKAKKAPEKVEINLNKMVEDATNDIHSGLLVGGGKEMKARVWSHLLNMLNTVAQRDGTKLVVVNIGITPLAAWALEKK